MRCTHQPCLIRWISERGSWSCELCYFKYQVLAISTKNPLQVRCKERTLRLGARAFQQSESGPLQGAYFIHLLTSLHNYHISCLEILPSFIYKDIIGCHLHSRHCLGSGNNEKGKDNLSDNDSKHSVFYVSRSWHILTLVIFIICLLVIYHYYLCFKDCCTKI